MVPLRAGLGAGDHEAPVGRQWASEVHTFWPSMTHSSPSRRALVVHVGQVGAGAGLGVALAPQLLDGHDLRQEPLLLLRRCRSAISVGPSSSSPRWLTRAGASAAGVLLVEDHLLRRATARGRRTPSGQPTQVQPCCGEVPVPGQPLVDAPRARGRARPAPRSSANSPERFSSSQARTSARNASSSRTVGAGPCRTVPYQALAWLRSRDGARAGRGGALAHAPGRLRPPAGVRRPPGVRRAGDPLS